MWGGGGGITMASVEKKIVYIGMTALDNFLTRLTSVLSVYNRYNRLQAVIFFCALALLK